MSKEYKRNKWYDASEKKPQYMGSINFVTKDGKKSSGTYIGYGQYESLREDIFETEKVSKWIIRERMDSGEKREMIKYQGIEITVRAMEDIGFYWRASFLTDKGQKYVNRESKKEAITSIKNKITA